MSLIGIGIFLWRPTAGAIGEFPPPTILGAPIVTSASSPVIGIEDALGTDVEVDVHPVAPVFVGGATTITSASEPSINVLVPTGTDVETETIE